MRGRLPKHEWSCLYVRVHAMPGVHLLLHLQVLQWHVPHGLCGVHIIFCARQGAMPCCVHAGSVVEVRGGSVVLFVSRAARLQGCTAECIVLA